jgi:hypothetical protein
MFSFLLAPVQSSPIQFNVASPVQPNSFNFAAAAAADLFVGIPKG